MSTKHEAAIKRYNVVLANGPRKPFYVYQYSLDGVPFYIGVGGSDHRYLDHLVHSHSQLMRRKLAKLRRTGVPFEIRIVFHTKDRERALRKEMDLIAEYGMRGKGGTLLNRTPGGDGGDTYNGRVMYYNPRTDECRIFPEGRQPKGWRQGRPSKHSTAGYVFYHDPVSGDRRRLPPGEKAPKGYIEGLPKGLKTGPRGKIIISNPTTCEHRWVAPSSKIPRGWIRGRSHVGSTKGRIGYHDPATGQKVYLAEGIKPPRGWKKGIPPTTGKPVKVGKLKFPNVQAAMDHLNTSRYKLTKRPDFTYL